MRIAVTGASGFLGSALVQRHLDAGDDVRCLVRRTRTNLKSGVCAVEGDLCAPDERLTRFADGVDVLYHCAAEVIDPGRMRTLNVEGTRALLRAASGRIGRWVQVSSVGVYGHPVGVVSEESRLDPGNAYEATKAEADSLVMEARARRDVASSVVLRPSIVFGAGMPNQSIVQMIRMIERGLFFFIGRAGASANYVHVTNVVDALTLCARSAGADGRVYNVSDWCTVEEFAGAIADALGRRRPRLRLPERPVRGLVRLGAALGSLPLTSSRVDALVSRARYPIERLRRELNYAIRVSIPCGLVDMVAQGRSS
jgi:nucleoside-diphosphate-sugar epimerase